MKIMIPIEEDSSGLNISNSFRNAAYAMIYHSELQTFELIETEILKMENTFRQFLQTEQISAVISRSMPLMALNFFSGNGLLVCQAQSRAIDENIDLFLQNKLKRISTEAAQSAGNCAGSCKSCNTNCNT